VICELPRSPQSAPHDSERYRHRPSRGSASRLEWPSHPLDPLNGEEIREVVKILRQERPLASRCRFVTIQLREPERPWMEAWQPGQPWDRQAFAVLLDPAEGSTYEAVVSLSRQQVCSWQLVPGVQPPLLDDEVYACDRLLKADPLVVGSPLSS
jgi:primary-amine oxidase